jgi:ribosomal protein L3 glutamine methyltransferase
MDADGRVNRRLSAAKVSAGRAWTVGGLVRAGTRRFRLARLAFGHGTANARDEAAYLALHALGLPLDTPAGVCDRRVAARDARRVLELFGRRIESRKPAAYLTREAWLGKCRFQVDERVVVPRSHIAGLLRESLAPWIRDRGSVRRALDLGTGSACLAILLAHAFPRARIDAADISAGALAVARLNVRDHGMRARIRLVASDLFSALGSRRYDVIVSNPPYVDAASMRRLPPEYRHEPAIALAGGRDGLDAVRRIVARAREHLDPGGLLVVEVGRARRHVERAFPQVAFAWPETAAGHAVFIVEREGLPR